MTITNFSPFADTYVLSPLNPTCFKNLENPSCIYLLLTNFKPSFLKTNVLKIGISDHNKMISTIMKVHFTRKNTKNISDISSELSCQLDSTFCPHKENEDFGDLYEFIRFHRNLLFLNLLNIQTPLKEKI